MNAAVAPDTRLDGPALRLLRVSKYVTATAVARQLGVTRQRVLAIEANHFPTSAAVDRYLRALAAAERAR